MIKRLIAKLAGTSWDYKIAVLTDLLGALLLYPYNKMSLGKMGKGTIVYLHARFYGRTNIFMENNVTVHTGAELTAYKNNARIQIGSHSVIHRFCNLNAFDGSIKIGHNCTFNQNCVIHGNGDVTIGNNVRIAAGTTIMASNHRFDDVTVPIFKQNLSTLGIVIGDDVWIGTGCRILDGVKIGNGCVIGAGAVVTKDIPDLSVAVGVPARIISNRAEQSCPNTFSKSTV